ESPHGPELPTNPPQKVPSLRRARRSRSVPKRPRSLPVRPAVGVLPADGPPLTLLRDFEASPVRGAFERGARNRNYRAQRKPRHSEGVTHAEPTSGGPQFAQAPRIRTLTRRQRQIRKFQERSPAGSGCWSQGGGKQARRARFLVQLVEERLGRHDRR